MKSILSACNEIALQDDWNKTWGAVGGGAARKTVLMIRSPEFQRHSTLIYKLATLERTASEELERIHLPQWFRALPTDIGLEEKLAELMSNSGFIRGTHTERVAMLFYKAGILAREQGLCEEQLAVYESKIREINSLGDRDLYDEVVKALLERNWRVRRDAIEALKKICSGDSVNHLASEIEDGNAATKEEALQCVLREIADALRKKAVVQVGNGVPVTGGSPTAEQRGAVAVPKRSWKFWKKLFGSQNDGTDSLAREVSAHYTYDDAINRANMDASTVAWPDQKVRLHDLAAQLACIKSGTSSIDAKDSNGWTALTGAARFGHTETVNLLLSNGADVNAEGYLLGVTALMSATTNGRTETVKLLLSKGADVNISDREGNTALMLAVSSNHEDIVTILLSNGADVNAKRKGESVLMMANKPKMKELLKMQGSME
jgi:hypothetical protein